MNETGIFKALADPNRRLVMERLAAGTLNATELREGLGISQPAMSQHLAVLRDAGLISEERAGRVVNYAIDARGLMALDRWLDRYRQFWPSRIERLRTLLKEMDQ
jgi:DNA-binding transcriptional ArsR family regulator